MYENTFRIRTGHLTLTYDRLMRTTIRGDERKPINPLVIYISQWSWTYVWACDSVQANEWRKSSRVGVILNAPWLVRNSKPNALVSNHKMNFVPYHYYYYCTNRSRPLVNHTLSYFQWQRFNYKTDQLNQRFAFSRS